MFNYVFYKYFWGFNYWVDKDSKGIVLSFKGFRIFMRRYKIG